MGSDMDNDSDSAANIVRHARALGPHERLDYIRHACGSDETLLSRVLQALSTQEPCSLQDGMKRDEDSADTVVQRLEGQRLGCYRILRKLGEGGMGDVYLAERADEEYQQQVAIKLVRSGAFSAHLQGRLRMERQILASLQHPNIARLLDGGRASDGTPYLVMEYIEGEPIDVYCDKHRLTIAERVQLVRIICAAVHHAHQNLIVHRDLKPSNILITPAGVPKLLDFGIAKLLDDRRPLNTLAVTQFGYRVMTPAHASPEQVRGDTITTASDIYVLGVLLYELLCGCRPFQLAGARFTELERIICEKDPLPPSARMARNEQDAPHLAHRVAADRATTPARLRKQLEGDLDDIIGMAMRKDAERRYGSAEQLSTDLNRCLEGKPVMARSDTWRYRSGKFIRRHALAVSSASAALVTLAAFATITLMQSHRIAYERDQATIERSRAAQISSFLVELFELSDPSRTRGNQVTAREMLDIGARRVTLGLSDQPETRADLLGTIGTVYQNLGLYSDAVPLLEEALASRVRLRGPRHPDVAAAKVALGGALCDRGDLRACEEQLGSALQMQRSLLGPAAIEVAPTLLAQAHLAQMRGALQIAERYYVESLAIYRRHGRERTPEAASLINELAGLHSYRGEHDRAATLYRTALDIDRQTLGSDHPHVGIHLLNLALTAHLQGQLAEAEPLYTQSMQILSKVLGEEHPQTLDAAANYGRFLHRKGEFGRAEEVFNRVLQLNRKARGERHAFVGHDLVNIGLLHLETGRYDEAERDFLAALDVYAASLPDDHPFIASALTGLGRCQLEQHRILDAQRSLTRAKEIAARSFGPASAQLAAARSTLGRVLLAQQRTTEAGLLLRDSYPVLVDTQGENALITRRAREAIELLELQRSPAENPDQTLERARLSDRISQPRHDQARHDQTPPKKDTP